MKMFGKFKKGATKYWQFLVVLPFLFVLFYFIVVAFANPGSEDFDASACIVDDAKYATCGSPVSNVNDNSTSTVGATVAKGGVVGFYTWTNTDSTSDNYELLDAEFHFRHSALAGITGDWTINWQNDAGTSTYCSDTTPHVVGDTYVFANTTGACSWTQTKLDDLRIEFASGDAGGSQDAYIYYVDMFIYVKDNPPWHDQESDNSSAENWVGDVINHTTRWQDDINTALDSYIFSTNASGSWENASVVSFGGGLVKYSENLTTLPDGCATLIGWKFYANDTNNNWNVSDEQTYNCYKAGILEVDWHTNSEINSTTCTEGNPCNFNQYSTFTANATVTCAGGGCGNVSGSVRYNSTGSTMIPINTTEGATPFFIPNGEGGEETLLPDSTHIAYKKATTTGINPGSATDVFTDGEYDKVNTSNDVNVTATAVLPLKPAACDSGIANCVILETPAECGWCSGACYWQGDPINACLPQGSAACSQIGSEADCGTCPYCSWTEGDYSGTRYAHFRFTFDLSDPKYGIDGSRINNITYSYEGFYNKTGSETYDAYLSFKNSTGWFEDQSLTTSEANYTKSFTSGISDLITDGKFQFGATGNVTSASTSANITIQADYVKLIVNYTSANPYSFGSMSDGDQHQLNFTINVSTSSEQGNLIDFNFSSSYGNVPENSTNDAYLWLNPTIYGTLEVNLSDPYPNTYDESNPLEVTQYTTFWMNATINCVGETGAICDEVNGTARYNESTDPDTKINVTEWATPFYVVEEPMEIARIKNKAIVLFPYAISMIIGMVVVTTLIILHYNPSIGFKGLVKLDSIILILSIALVYYIFTQPERVLAGETTITDYSCEFVSASNINCLQGGGECTIHENCIGKTTGSCSPSPSCPALDHATESSNTCDESYTAGNCQECIFATLCKGSIQCTATGTCNYDCDEGWYNCDEDDSTGCEQNSPCATEPTISITAAPNTTTVTRGEYVNVTATITCSDFQCNSTNATITLPGLFELKTGETAKHELEDIPVGINYTSWIIKAIHNGTDVINVTVQSVNSTGEINDTDSTDSITVTEPENPKSCGSMTQGETCTIKWLINATGTVNSVYKIDVNFTSNNTNVVWNDTNNSIVKIVSAVVDTAPTFEYNNSNTTSISPGEPVLIYANWSDDIALNYSWLWTNETGGNGMNYTDGTYDSPYDINLTDGQTWSNFTWDNDSFASGVVAWKIYANDSAGNENVTGEMNFTVHYLEVSLINPASSYSAPQNQTFAVNASVYCRGGECGTVSGTAMYNSSTSGIDTLIPTSATTPFHATEGDQPQTCGAMGADGFCQLNWTVNATGDADTVWEIGVNFSADVSSVPDNTTENSTITITVCTVEITLSWDALDFGSVDPDSLKNANPYSGNANNLTNITNSGSCTLEIWIKGTLLENKTYPIHTIGVGNISWGNESLGHLSYNDAVIKENMTTSYALAKDSLTQNTNVTTYYWLEVPAVYKGIYNGTISVCGNSTDPC